MQINVVVQVRVLANAVHTERVGEWEKKRKLIDDKCSLLSALTVTLRNRQKKNDNKEFAHKSAFF